MIKANNHNRDSEYDVQNIRNHVAKRIRQIYDCLAYQKTNNIKNCEMPYEVAIEIQHALAHLALVSDTLSKEQKEKRWRQALAHLDRALIDFLKIFTLHKFPSSCNSIEFMEEWLGTRKKEYIEHASSTQSPDSSVTIDNESMTVENYKRILNIALDIGQLIFSGDNLKGDKWNAYSRELDNWMNTNLMLGGLTAEKNLVDLKDLLNTLWNLNTQALADLNLKMQIKTLVKVSNLGMQYKWRSNLWTRIQSILGSNQSPTKDEALPLYREFLRYFKITQWKSIDV